VNETPSGTFHTLGPYELPGGLPARKLRVYVPEGPSDELLRPVLYLFDGQNVFADEGSFSGGWYAHDAADRLLPLRRGIAPIVVGIDNGGASRLDELGPWVNKERGGKADRFLDWVCTTALPEVQSRFNVEIGPSSTIIGGSSMGGLGSLYFHFKRPDVFGGALCMSSAFWFAGDHLLPFLSSQPRPQPSRVYLDVGLREGPQMVGPSTEVATYLKARGWSTKDLMWRKDAKGTHSEKHWARRLRKALRFFFVRDRPIVLPLPRGDAQKFT
jgi:predicted alpha/beta superfamily hydrolase